jgi:hypothetical protein
MTLLEKALCYKPEGSGFDSRWDYWILSIYIILPAKLWPWVNKPIAEITAMNIPGVEMLPAHKADILTAICDSIA